MLQTAQPVLALLDNKSMKEGHRLGKRGFEVVNEKHRTNFDIFTDEKKKEHRFPTEIKLPTRSDPHSAGYDFYLPKDITILPRESILIFSDVKAYMQKDEVLKLYIRSSLAIKRGLILSNNVAIIDSSYYNNEDNDGNIGFALKNTTGKTIKLLAGERIVQGIFLKYLTADEDTITSKERTGGIGSSGK